MVVGILILELRIPGARSLKDKRHVLRSVLDKCRDSYRVAIAEVGDNDLWGNAVVCATCPSSSRQHAESVLNSVLLAFDKSPDLDTTSTRLEWWLD